MASDYIFKKSAFGGYNREDVIAYISKVKAEETIMKNALEEEKAKNAELANMLQDAEKKQTEAEEDYKEKIKELNESHKIEIERIKQEYEEKLQNSIIADRSAEEKVGSAMLDVRRYADLLIHETCEKIDKMSDDADAATAKTLTRVLDISSGIQAFSDKLNTVLKDILMENEDICKELTGFKGSLRLPYEVASGKIMADILED